MRAITPELIETLVRGFSHGAETHYDPRREIGTQRESFDGLGFGWLYIALAQILEARRILVIGSGRGFVVACFALAVEDRPEARVWLVDPGFAEWPVEGGVVDSAPGLWSDPERAREHFRRHLGLERIELVPRRSDEAFDEFRRDGSTFDLILIDGDHGYEQVLRDLENALRCLTPEGVVLMHDTACPQWSGPPLALRQCLGAHPELESVTLSSFPGLSLVRRASWPLEIRHATAEENERINVWRAADDVTERPLPDGDDPRPGEVCADPREGLYAVLEQGELIGGFGIRRRRFGGGGPDDFFPSSPAHAAGFLRYGTVLRPDLRGRGRWHLVATWAAALFRDEGMYLLTSHPRRERRSAPYEVHVVGEMGPFTAYWERLPPETPFALGLDRQVERLRAERDRARSEASSQSRSLALTQRSLAAVQRDLAVTQRDREIVQRDLDAARRDLARLRGSTSWRLTAPLRAAMDRLRGRVPAGRS